MAHRLDNRNLLMQSQRPTARSVLPLFVDLDGTLIRSDILHESALLLLQRNPFCLFLLPIWLLRGKAYLKQQIADRVDLRVDLLPYHPEFLEYLQEQHRGDRKLILATASNRKYADAVAKHLGIFDRVMASDASNNLSGKEKAERFREAYGEKQFCYAGNARVDVHVWRHAGGAVLVNPHRGVRVAAEEVTSLEAVFEDKADYLKQFIKAMRPHQWLKNLLVFIPLILAHRYTETQLIMQALMAFGSFSLCASSVYLLNDLLDLAPDRQHRTKKERPFAAGRLPILAGVSGMIVLLIMAFAIASRLAPQFLFVLSLYYASTMLYSMWLKRVAMVDVLLLAGLYTLRLIAGAAAISGVTSFWLLAFAVFLFLSLALIKRYSELLTVVGTGQGKMVGRGYWEVDLETLGQLGTSSGYLAVLVLALYINSDKVRSLYSQPEVLWVLCPMMLYWISRLWLLTRRDRMHEDPVVFTIRDRRTYALALIALVALVVAT